MGHQSEKRDGDDRLKGKRRMNEETVTRVPGQTAVRIFQSCDETERIVLEKRDP
jgi:hypothetical protein